MDIFKVKVDIRQCIDASGMSLREVAAKSGVSKSSIIRWENGESRPTVESYVRVIKAIGMDVAPLQQYGIEIE